DVNMVTTLQLVDAALSNIRNTLPPTATIQTHRLTFASFPIIGYSLTSATVLVQGGQEPEFQITPDPAKLLAASVTVSDILDAVRRTNLVDSPGLLEQKHQ